MLVRDPSKRYSLAMVQKHHWMQTEVPPSSSLAAILLKKQPHDISEISETRKHNLKTKKLNEQVLRVMQSLGIDPVRTTEVRKPIDFKSPGQSLRANSTWLCQTVKTSLPRANFFKRFPICNQGLGVGP